MEPSRNIALKAGLVAVVLAAVALLLVRALRGRGPYDVESVELSGWTLEASAPGEPSIVALTPPAQLSTDLFQQLLRRTGESLVAWPDPAVPLVLRDEYADSLQGVLTVEDIVDAARDAGLETARFEPVCVGRRSTKEGRADTTFFVLFEAAAFDDFRERLTPLFPEHAGAFPYDPKALSPVLTIATTHRDAKGPWPFSGSLKTDCSGSLRVQQAASLTLPPRE